MISFQFQGPGKPLPWSTRLMLILVGLASIVFLSFFAFTFVIVAVVVAALLFLLNLFGIIKPPKRDFGPGPGPENFPPGFPPSNKPPHTKRKIDDDVIDV